MARSTYLYVAYIRTTPEKLWQALTDPQFTRQYWFGMASTSEFRKGSPWKLVAGDGKVWDSGEIVESDPPRRLVMRWQHEMRPELKAEGPALCTIELQPEAGAVKLTITHTSEHENSKVITAVSGGWPKVISNLKSFLETGSVALLEAYPSQAAKSA